MTIKDAFTTAYIVLFALILAYWLWGKIVGRKIDNSEAWEEKHPKRVELRSLPYRFRWWHIPILIVQASFVFSISYAVISDNPGKGGAWVIVPLLAIGVCAFLTACITQSWDWVVRRLRGLRGHGGETSGHSLGSTGPGGLLSKTPEERKRIGVRD